MTPSLEASSIRSKIEESEYEKECKVAACGRPSGNSVHSATEDYSCWRAPMAAYGWQLRHEEVRVPPNEELARLESLLLLALSTISCQRKSRSS